ncbi:MAG: hypothetical protein KDC44_15495, partial [Phaeodactylibacter sp.]|nr:hypothetical protein [Phaeodactylibacter sp.]
LVYHNYHFANEVARQVQLIGQGEDYNTELLDLVATAAWLYPTGFLIDYKSPKQYSLEIAKTFLQVSKTEKSKANTVLQALTQAYQLPQIPSSPEGMLLADAIQAHEFGHQFFEHSPYLQLEIDLVSDQQFSKKEWAEYILQRLQDVHFFTGSAKTRFEPIIAGHLLNQKQISRKLKVENPEKISRKFQEIEQRTPRSGAQTFFRTAYRNHINLSAIADNKANIMISVNAILISVIITYVSYNKSMTESNPMVLLPVFIFLVTGLSSLIFAVLSARPKVTTLIKKDDNLFDRRKNIAFFGNFVHMNLSEYEEAMDHLLKDGELLYGNLTRDLYHLGKVLDKKYSYITISYNLFMVGFAATVITFLIALFT